MSPLAASDHSFVFCGQQVTSDGVVVSPCTGCISRFSCRGYWSQPAEKPASVEIAALISPAHDDDSVTRFDRSHERREVREQDLCTIA